MLLCVLALRGHAREEKSLKVDILAGQSNMTGMISSKTLEHIKMFPDTARVFADLFDEIGEPLVLDDVYVSQWKEKDGGKLASRFGGGKGVRFGPAVATEQAMGDLGAASQAVVGGSDPRARGSILLAIPEFLCAQPVMVLMMKELRISGSLGSVDPQLETGLPSVSACRSGATP